MRRTRGMLSILALGIMALAVRAEAIDVSASGSWSLSINSADLVSGAGSDLNGNYESGIDQVLLSIINTAGNSDNWRIDVHRVDTSWHNDLLLYVKRTGDGTGTGSITGGGAYIEAGVSASSFFSGGGDRSDVPLQLKVSGMSVSVPPATYSTTITYTVVDTL